MMIIAIYFVLFLNFTFSAKSFINSWKNDNIIDKLTEKERLNAEVNPKQLFKKMNSSLNTGESSIKIENTSYKKPHNIYTSNPKPVVENKNNSITSKKYEKELEKLRNEREEMYSGNVEMINKIIEVYGKELREIYQDKQ